MAKNDDINKKSIRCSFCGKHQDQVSRIIAGPGAYICNECVALCNSILDDGEYDGPPDRRGHPRGDPHPRRDQRGAGSVYHWAGSHESRAVRGGI